MTSPPNNPASVPSPGATRRFAMKALPWVAALASGAALALAFIPFEWSALAWVALIPLLLGLEKARPRRAFALGFCALSLYWLVTIFWLTRVTVPGWILLSLYCGLYGGAFAWLARGLLQDDGKDRWWRNVLVMIALSAGWVALEWVRATLLTGFSWNPLGVALYRHGVLIQVAELGGVYLLSALVVWMNVALALTIRRYARMRGRVGRAPHVEAALAVMVLAAAFAWGLRALRAGHRTGGPVLRAALVQPDIEQALKWDDAQEIHIRSRLRSLTAAAAGVPDLELIVWPETALPDFLRDSPESMDLVLDAVSHGVPLLLGGMDFEITSDRRALFFNSALLLDAQGRIRHRYDKQHLVMFGEYIPMASLLPFLRSLSPIPGDFVAGKDTAILPLGEGQAPAAVLICFEDVVAPLAVRAARADARILVNLTNDAWFDPLWGARQHQAVSLFRAVETRLPLVRCTNTGMTCWIDRWGRIRDEMEPRTPGFMTVNVPWEEGPVVPTFYVRCGDRFAHACLALTLGLAFWLAWRQGVPGIRKTGDKTR